MGQTSKAESGKRGDAPAPSDQSSASEHDDHKLVGAS